jgi:hypothetical protein
MIAVQTNAKDVPNLTLRFTVEATAPILFEPRSQIVVYTFEGEAAQERLLLRRADGEQLVVHGAETSSEYLETVIDPVIEKEERDGIEANPGDVWLDLKVSPQAPLGTLSGKIQVASNHPKAQSFGIHYVARVRRVVDLRPNGVRLWLLGSKDGAGKSTWVRLIHNLPGNFNVTSLDVSHPEFFSASALSNEAARQQAVRVKLVEGLTPEALGKTIEGWIEITTDLQPGVKLELPVLIGPTRAGTRRPFHQR